MIVMMMVVVMMVMVVVLMMMMIKISPLRITWKAIETYESDQFENPMSSIVASPIGTVTRTYVRSGK